MSAEIISFSSVSKSAGRSQTEGPRDPVDPVRQSGSDAFLSFLVQMHDMAIEAWVPGPGGDAVLARVADPTGRRFLILVSELEPVRPDTGPEYA